MRRVNKACQDLLPADTDMPAPAMTTIFCLLCRTRMTRSSWSCWWSFLMLPVRKSRCCVERSLGSREILLRLAGGGPSVSVAGCESIPWLPMGDPECEVCCDEGGEGYARAGSGGMSGGGDREGGGLESGEERTLEGGDDSGLETSRSSSAVDLTGVDVDVVARPSRASWSAGCDMTGAGSRRARTRVRQRPDECSRNWRAACRTMDIRAGESRKKRRGGSTGECLRAVASRAAVCVAEVQLEMSLSVGGGRSGLLKSSNETIDAFCHPTWAVLLRARPDDEQTTRTRNLPNDATSGKSHSCTSLDMLALHVIPFLIKLNT